MSSYVPHPIPYQGSKRNIAKAILKFFPADIDTLIEPFAGSAAISIASSYYHKVNKFHINDLNEPLIMLWDQVVNDPQKISDNYEKLWYEQLGREREYYNYIRDQFNKTKKPEYFLYLLARCVKGSVRYNSNGEFNQSPDNRRKGRQPANMRNDILAVTNLLKNKVVFTSQDYRKVLKSAKSNDLIYMDPPYQGVSNTRDPRYYNSVSVNELIDVLTDLNNKKLLFILSYDGKKGDKNYGKKLPSHLELYHIELKVGRSTQATLLGSNEITYESLYLSNELLLKLKNKPERFIDNSNIHKRHQLNLPLKQDILEHA